MCVSLRGKTRNYTRKKAELKMLSIIIPSCKDKYLQKTIDDIRKNARGEIQLVVVFDGFDQKITGADLILSNDRNRGLRYSVNRGASASSGEYIMKTDEHCAFAESFDVKLLADIEDNWVVTPSRYKLDVEKWEIMNGPPTDIDRLVTDRPDKIGGLEWRSRAIERKDILIDETMVFQGSCWVMSRKHWDWLGGLQEEGYGTFAQEPIEICLKTWLGGGRVVVNKKTWHAHKHRKFGRAAQISSAEREAGNKYSMDFWLNNRWEKRIHDLEWLMQRFGLKYKIYEGK